MAFARYDLIISTENQALLDLVCLKTSLSETVVIALSMEAVNSEKHTGENLGRALCFGEIRLFTPYST